MRVKIGVILLLLNICVYSQINGNRFELSFSGTFGEVKASSESTSSTYGYTSEGEFNFYFFSNIRFGYLLNTNFEIEPEIQILLLKHIDPSYSINANMVYNIDNDSSKIKPFLLLGYGIGNAVPAYGSLFSFADYIGNNFSVHQFNAGLGMKIFVTNNIAIRSEYRFQQYSYKKEYSNVNTTTSYTYYFHQLLFGVSYFL